MFSLALKNAAIAQWPIIGKGPRVAIMAIFLAIIVAIGNQIISIGVEYFVTRAPKSASDSLTPSSFMPTKVQQLEIVDVRYPAGLGYSLSRRRYSHPEEPFAKTLGWYADRVVEKS